MKTPRFLKHRVELIQDRYSEAKLQKLSRGWKPWDHLGKDDKKLIRYKRYGKFGGYAANLFYIYRHKIHRFRESGITVLNSLMKKKIVHHSLSKLGHRF